MAQAPATAGAVAVGLAFSKIGALNGKRNRSQTTPESLLRPATEGRLTKLVSEPLRGDPSLLKGIRFAGLISLCSSSPEAEWE